MPACMYDDAEATAVCPGCEFGVCQACLDGGGDGYCATCAEDIADRRANSAIQVARCAFCRAAEDPETPLDQDGYCAVCAERTRCVTHPAALSVERCKGCRKPHCRQCLGFSDYCEPCRAAGRAAPPKRPASPKPRPAPGRPGSPPRPAARPGSSAPARAGAKGRPGSPKPKAPMTRGEAALRARMEAERQTSWLPWLGLGGIVVVGLVLVLQAASGGP